MIHKIIVVVGPNASGKSDLGVALARKYNGEIISADSRQVYKGLDIGSGKITKKEMRGISHHCLDIVSPKTRFSADDFKKYGARAIQKIVAKNKIPIIVGGTGFYIDVLLGRIDTATVPPNPALRKKLEKKSATQLFEMLKKLDPKRAQTIDPHNPRRLVRAIEIANYIENFSEKNSRRGRAVPEYNSDLVRDGDKEFFSEKFSILWLGVKRSPEELKKRIHTRLLKRMRGIINEVRSLHKKGVSWQRLYDLGLEYRFISQYIHSSAEIRSPQKRRSYLREMTQKLEKAIWHYARRQMTWFRRNPKIHWTHSPKEMAVLVKKFLKDC